MAGNDYEIRTGIVVSDEAGPGLDAIGGRIKRVERQAESTGSRISGFFGKAFALAGGTFAAKQIAGGITGIHSEVETATGSIAALSSALFAIPIEESIGVAEGIFERLNKAAAVGVGETKDYTKAFGMLLAPLSAAGAELKNIEKFAGLGLTAGFAIKGVAGLEQAPLDIVQALQQGISERITPIAARVVEAAGISSAAFNKMNVADKMKALEKGFGLFEEGAKLMGKSWEAQSATLRDNIKQIARSLTAPLFDRWKDGLTTVNTWLEKNHDWIMAIAEDLGGSVVKAWDQVISKAGTYAAIVAAIGISDTLPSLPGGSGRSRAGAKGGGGFGFDPKRIGAQIMEGVVLQKRSAGKDLFGKRGGAVRSKTGLNLGALPGNLATALFGGAGGAKAGGGIKMPTQGALGMGGAGVVLPKLAASLTAIAGPAILVTGLLVGVAGALEEWPSLWGLLIGLGTQLTTSFGMLGEAFGGLTESGSALNLIGMAAIGVLYGVGMALNVVVRAAALVVEGVGYLAVTLGTMAKMAFQTSRMMMGAMTGNVQQVQAARVAYKAARAEGSQSLANSAHRMKKILGLLPDASKKAAGEAAGGGLPGGGGLPNVASNVTNIGTVNVDAKSTINDDPARIAMGWTKVLSEVQRNPRAAKRSSSPLLG